MFFISYFYVYALYDVSQLADKPLYIAISKLKTTKPREGLLEGWGCHCEIVVAAS